MIHFSSVRSLNCVQLFVTPGTTAHKAGFPVHHQLPEFTKLMSTESVMPSSHFILCCLLLLLPSIFPSISLFQWVSSSHHVAKVYFLFQWFYTYSLLIKCQFISSKYFISKNILLGDWLSKNVLLKIQLILLIAKG